jgi:hypothetical protein
MSEAESKAYFVIQQELTDSPSSFLDANQTIAELRPHSHTIHLHTIHGETLKAALESGKSTVYCRTLLDPES